MDGPDFTFEAAAAGHGFLRIAGVDEVGRGPLAGPVLAAAVVLDPARIPGGLNDSKKLTARRRALLHDQLMEVAEISVAEASVEEIDQINILQASHLAMVRAVTGLGQPPDYVLVDGHMMPKDMPVKSETIVGGDGRSFSIAAASIVAKFRRDQIMMDLAQQYPGYGWDTNMGYGSKKHMEALANLGPTPHHRRSFKPVYNML